MLRTLLATTALAALMTGGAVAQSTTTTPAGDMTTSAGIFAPRSTEPQVQGVDGFFAAYPGQLLTSWLIGQPLYEGVTAEDAKVGDVNDIVVSPDGQAEAVIVGVGGFLGIGEKEVAIDFSRINWARVDEQPRLVIDLTKEELDAAPAFDRNMVQTEYQWGNSTAAAMDDTAMSSQSMSADAVPLNTLSAAELIGTQVTGTDGAVIGTVGDVLLDADNKVEAFVVDVGGFLGIGQKPVAIAAANLNAMRNADGGLEVNVPFSRERLESQTAYTEDAYKATPDAVMLR